MIETGKTGKPILGVIGFLGRGNVGDEGIFQCIYEAFQNDFDIVAVVDEHGARQGWWDWYPYTEIDRIHQGNIHYFEKRIAGLLVGGGGLGLGFGGSQVMVARGAGTPTAFAGTDHTHPVQLSGQLAVASKAYLELFDYVALRSQKSVDLAGKLGVAARYGADWAFNMVTDESPEVVNNNSRAAIAFREFGPDLVDPTYYRQQASELIETLQAFEYKPFLLPFSPEDDEFANRIALNALAPSEVHWWNARRVQQLIASSGLVVSVGRLHSMIFAASAGTPNVQIMPPLQRNSFRHFDKMQDMATELHVPYVNNLSDALPQIAKAQNRASVEAAKERLKIMIRDLRVLFTV